MPENKNTTVLFPEKSGHARLKVLAALEGRNKGEQIDYMVLRELEKYTTRQINEAMTKLRKKGHRRAK